MPPDNSSLEYLLPADLSPTELGHRLVTVRGIEKTGTEVLERTLLDTFDWRLHRNGSLAEAIGGDQPMFRWYRRMEGRVLQQLPGAPPRFAWDLPSGSFRQDLEQQVEVRALLPQVRVVCRVQHFTMRDKQGKIVLRLRVSENTLPGQPDVPLRPRLQLDPVRGYPKALARARREVSGPLRLEPSSEDLFTEALAELHIIPGTYSSKVKVQLEPELPAGKAIRMILLRLLDTMEANEAGALADLDSEFLHDFRVAVRRTRSALGQIKGVLPSEVLDRFREEFAWLGAITSPTRDMDVYLLNFPEYQANLPPGVRPHLEPLHQFLVDHQKAEQKALATALRSPRYRAIKMDWRRFLESDPGEGKTGHPANARRPVQAVARKRIWKVYSKVLRDGEILDAGCPAEWFHDLRKTCKKLRYLLEFFQSLFSPDEVSSLIKSLKIIQDNLGVHNDLEVQALALTGFGRRMQEEGAPSAECLMAMGMLVEDLGRRQVQVRGEFAELFVPFSTGATRRRFRKLFAPPGRRKGKGARR